MRVLPVPDSVAVTIRCPSGPIQELWGYLRYKEFTTQDYGRIWTPELLVKPIPSPLAVAWNDFAQAPSDPSVLYRYVQEMGLYLRSDDGGKSWSPPRYSIEGLSREEFAAKFGRNSSYTEAFHLAAIDPKEPHRIYAGVELVTWASLIYMVSGPIPAEAEVTDSELEGLYVSGDGGESWTKFTGVLKNSLPIGISPSNLKIMYGQSDRGVVKTEDGGDHWSLIGQSDELSKQPLRVQDKDPEYRRNAPKIELEILQFVVDPGNPDVVFIVSNKGVYRSLDGGKSWCLLNLGFDELGSMRSIAINPAKRNELFVGTTMGVFYSKDRGCHFQRIYPKR